jgi:hypothetical protein
MKQQYNNNININNNMSRSCLSRRHRRRFTLLLLVPLLLLLSFQSSQAAYTSNGFTSCNAGNNNVQAGFMSTTLGTLAAGGT